MRSLRSGHARRIMIQQGEKEEEVMVNINTTPLIDVMLVLLVMLIITIPLQTQSVQLALGRAVPVNETKLPKTVTIGIDFDNSLSIDDTAISNEDALLDRFREIAANSDQPVVIVKPNRLANYKNVAIVLADAQRLGVKKITIANQQ